MVRHRIGIGIGDNRTASLILHSSNPHEIKHLGQQVSGFDAARWNHNCTTAQTNESPYTSKVFSERQFEEDTL